ncbi:MAG: ATP-dependent DNA helicase [Burkholderiaceae bacterium]
MDEINPKSAAQLAVEVRAAFSADGALAQAIDGFSARTSQADMAERVATAIEARGTLVAEAGTGTGKTFAYLVPALLAGGKVLLSTGSKPLQDQLFRKDLPAVRAALKVNAEIALLKGRANYVCLQRLAHAESEGLLNSREEAFHLREIVRFARITTSGDRAELASVPENASVWPAVTSTRENCPGTECPQMQECFVFKARRAAQAADVVVVNHHLFLADLALRDDAISDFLPAADTVILDEAHQLPEIAADFFGTSFSLLQVVDLSRDARGLGLTRAPDGAPWTRLADALERSARDLRLRLADAGLAAGRRVPLDRIEGGEKLAAGFEDIRQALLDLEHAFEANKNRDAELDLLGPRANALRESATVWMKASTEPAPVMGDGGGAPTVRWVNVTTLGAQFHATPLSFSDAFARARERQSHAWVLTSATLTTAGRFDHFLAEMGLADAQTAQWESPFEFEHQALLYLPEDLPQPLGPDFPEQVADAAWPLIEAAGGRTFVLCTTLRAVDRVADRLRDHLEATGLDLPLLVQGTGTRRSLIDQFRAAGNAILVGSVSFWEGIDIRGDALSLVVIDKLPFAPPDDPVVEAKIRWLKTTGRNAFMEYQLPAAVTLLKQGVGRLIRDENDRGVLMILDERLVTKPYGKTVIASLPPFSRTRRLARATAFLERRGDEA